MKQLGNRTATAAAVAAVAVVAVAAALAGCASPAGLLVGAGAPAGCAALAGTAVEATMIGIASGTARVDSAVFTAAAALAVAERGPSPAAAITPAAPDYCKVLGHVEPLDPSAPAIRFEVNLPLRWNGRSVQYGGGGFNGVLITGLSLVPAALYDQPSPLARGYVTVGTDSGHQNQPGQPPQAFALNDEALLNFAHAAYKKVGDVSVALMQRAYGRAPEKRYFVGSSEGGREGLTMAQRYPADFDGIFSRVPVIHWTGLQHAGLRDGLASMDDAWLRPEQVQTVHDAVLAACDALDGLADGIVSDPVACRRQLDLARLRCSGPAGAGCLSEAQLRAVQTLHSPLRLDAALANGLREYPGRGPGGEALPAAVSAGGWNAWWLGQTAPTVPPQPSNGIAWFYGAGAIQYFYGRDPRLDVRSYRAADHAARVQQVSALMDSTDPDLSAFHARGGRLVMLEHMADYAQSPYAGIAYFESVRQRLGDERTRQFARLYTAPGVDHVGTGAPANVDMLAVLADWVERGQPPGALQIAEQSARPPFAVQRSRPLCEWPQVPRFRGGDPAAAASFECRP